MTRRIHFYLAGLLVLCAGAVGVAAPLVQLGVPGPDRPGDFEMQRQQHVRDLNALPLIDKHRMEEIFQMRLDGSELLVTPLLTPTHEYQRQRAQIDGLPAPAAIVCWEISQDLHQIQFEFTMDDYSQRGIFSQIHILARPNNIDIEKTWQTGTSFRRIWFSQANSVVHMSIFANEGSGRITNINVSDRDFLSLRRDHSLETDTWLRPLFHDLMQEAAFAPEFGAAWQVLCDEWPADLNARRQIDPQIAALDADDFRVRRKAADALQKLGRNAALVILRMDRKGLSLEQNLRLDEVVAHFKPLTDVDAARLHNDPQFLLDCLYCDDLTTRKLALARLARVTGKDIKYDPDASEEERIAEINRLRKAIPPAKTDSAH